MSLQTESGLGLLEDRESLRGIKGSFGGMKCDGRTK
jgi:hypothetical protein